MALLILGVSRRKNTRLSGSLLLPDQRNLNHFGYNNTSSDSKYKIDHHHLFFHLLYRRHRKPGMLQFLGLQRVGRDLTTEQ